MERSLLVVSHNGKRYALDAAYVREAVWLPELTAIDEMPAHVRGVFNLRGRVVPVIDLDLRFGEACLPLRKQDIVVIMDSAARQVGVIVHELHDVISVASIAVEDIDGFHLPGGQRHFVSGAVKTEAGMVLLLDREAILARSADIDPASVLAKRASDETECDADRALLRQRTDALAGAKVAASLDTVPYAILVLEGELYGFPAEIVREFIQLRGLTPIPGAPSLVAGNINLRGDVLTVLDLRPLLGLEASSAANQAIVLELSGRRFGVRAAAIEDLVSIAAATVIPARAGDGRPAFFSGVTHIGDRLASLFDGGALVEALLARSPNQSTPRIQT